MFINLFIAKYLYMLLGQSPDDEEDDRQAKGKKGGGKRKQRQTVSSFYKLQLGKFTS